MSNEGAQSLQIDAPRYSYYIDPKWRSYIQNEMGLDPDQALDEAIRADNECLSGANRQGVILAITFAGATIAANGTPRAVTMPSRRSCSANCRSTSFSSSTNRTARHLRAPAFRAAGQTVVLGLVSGELADMESTEQLAKRIDEARKFLPLENLALSPQCGFASTMEGNLLTEEAAVAEIKAGG